MGINKKIVPVILIYFFALLVAVIFFFPYVVIVFTSLKTSMEVYQIPTTFFPKVWTFRNFIDVWTVVPLNHYLLNSIIIAICTTALTLVCAIPGAYALARLDFKGNKAYLYLIVLSQMFSPIVLLVGLFRVISWLNLLDSIWGLVLVNAAFNQAFAVWILRGFFITVPYEMEQSAWIDGCTRLQGLIKILLPVSAPGIITAVIFVFIEAWNEFTCALTLISTEFNKPLTVGIYGFFGKNQTEWQQLFAISIFAIIPVVILFLSIQKNLVSGLTAGGVKE
jgi:multiple sugar transport system permease protein